MRIMAMTDRSAPMTAPRKPAALERSFLLFFHATISGAFLVAYLTGDEDTYGMHVVAGYAVLGALALRVAAAVLAPAHSPLAWPRPRLAATLDNLARLLRGDRRARLERSPLYAWIAVLVLAAVGLASVSGAIADFVVRLEDLHEALGEIALYVVFGHIALVLALHALKPSGSAAPAPKEAVTR
jgi:cytochrome b